MVSRKPVISDHDGEVADLSALDPSTFKTFEQLPEALRKKLGRPKAEVTKARLTVRMDAVALERWRASGPGWQTRAAALLARHAPKAG